MLDSFMILLCVRGRVDMLAKKALMVLSRSWSMLGFCCLLKK